MIDHSQNIGIYAGAFDPIHEGHVHFALEALRSTGLDKIYFLVEPSPRHKQGVKAFEHRIEMVRRAIRHKPQLGLVVLKQARFTIHETWPLLQNRFAGASLSLLMGSDVFLRLGHWAHLDELSENVQFIVGVRNRFDTDLALHVHVIEHTKHVKILYRTFRAPVAHESSSRIRKALRHGMIPKGLDPDVEQYIRTYELYSSDYQE